MGGKNLLTMIGIALVVCLWGLGGVAEARSSYAGTYVKVNRSMPMEEILASKESCEQCHQRVTPMVVAQHQSSAHQKIGLTCADCHGKNHQNFKVVTALACAKCHQQQVEETRKSKHTQSWKKAWNNARYWSISEPMRRQGCERCHDIGYNFSDVRCDYCHSTHKFSANEARQPAACTTCHMGPDHPQAEALAESKHAGKVSCVDCHQVQGSHDVSKNMGIGGVSNGALLDSWNWAMTAEGKPKLKRPVITTAQFNQARQGNLTNCAKCHDQQFNEPWLNGADQVKMAIEQMLVEAQGLVEDLEAEGLLYPGPKDRPPIPGEGQKLVLGGNQLYVGTSKAEAIYFRMYKFAAAQGWKSAYHQDFKRAGTKGIGEMQQLMGQLQKEAANLRALQAKGEVPKTPVVQPGLSKGSMIVGLGGALLGAGLAFLYFRKKRRVQEFLPLILFLGILGATCWQSSPALAWDGPAGDVAQCQKCHGEQVKQLQTGKHRSLKCLDCHQDNAKKTQVRNPETCGRCHNETKGDELEIYLTSPHGVQYQTNGQDQWVPLCATCHMPKGGHNPLTKLTDGDQNLKGQIGEVCRQCHTTDHVDKFSADLKQIKEENVKMAASLKEIGLKLVDQGVLRPVQANWWDKAADFRGLWPAGTQWQLSNLEKLSPEDQGRATDLVTNLVETTQKGLEVEVRKMRVGVAHVNPDYTHWYGNAYLNLDIAEAHGSARQLTFLSNKAGGVEQQPWSIYAISAILGITVGFGVVGFLKKRQ